VSAELALLARLDRGYLDGLVPNLYPKPPAAAISALANTSGTADTYGAWGEVIPAGAIATDFVIVGYTGSFPTVASSGATSFGVGSAGAEVEIGALQWITQSSTGINIPAPVLTFAKPVKVAAGSRVAARSAVNSTSTTGRPNLVRIFFYPLS
jgi:hypothetical protein